MRTVPLENVKVDDGILVRFVECCSYCQRLVPISTLDPDGATLLLVTDAYSSAEGYTTLNFNGKAWLEEPSSKNILLIN